MVPKIQDMATLSKRSHTTSRASIGESTRTWSSRAEGEEDLIPPASVGGRGVEEDGDEGPDVLEAGGLEVELGDHGVGRVVPGSRSSWRGLVGGRGAGLGVDGLAGGDAEEVLLCLGDPESEGVGRGALALPGEGSHADPLLGRRSLRLGGEEGRGESGVGLLPAEGGGGERRIRGRHPEARPRSIRRGVGGGLLARGDSGAVGRSGGGGILQQRQRGLQGGRIGARGLQQLCRGP